jgi:NifU-like protein
MPVLAPKIKDHFLNPRNVGKMAEADCIGTTGTPGTGSGIKLFIKLDPGAHISRITYQIFNNAPAIAPASAFTELAAGKSLTDAGTIARADILAHLDCDEASAGNLRFDILAAFVSAVANLHGEDTAAPDPEAVAKQARAAEAASEAKAKTAAKPGPDAEGRAFNKPKLVIMQLIQDVLDHEIRPAIAMDGGDVELMDVQDRRVLLKLHGHCVGCSSSNTTMRFFIEDRLRELVDPGLEVIDTTAFEGELHAPPGLLPV